MTTLARYEVLREVGRGATTAVHAARDRSTGALVALKTLDPVLSKKPGADLAARFLKSARSAQRLRHPNIAKIHDAGEADGVVHVAMELLEGETLRKVLDRGPLPVARAIGIAHDIASALAHAHLEGVVHGALKPSNVIVLRSGAAKITDFRGDPVDHRCDLFALGALLYEMLTGRSPAREESLPPPSELDPNVPRALDRLVLGMLAREPNDRTPGAPIVLRELEQLQERLGLGAGAPAEEEEPQAGMPPPDHHEAMLTMERESRLPRRSGSRPGIFAALAATLAALAIGIYGFLYYSSSHPEKEVPPPVAKVTKEPVPEPAPAPAPVAQAPREPLLLPTAAPAPPPEQQPVRTAQLVVAVTPRGDVYIDGEHHGTTSVVTTFDLEPGMHRIEVRSGSRRPYLTYMTVEAGDVRQIRHDFNMKRMRPPR